MTTTVPPAQSSIAALDMRAATLSDLLDASKTSGVPACSIYRIVNEHAGIESEGCCDCL